MNKHNDSIKEGNEPDNELSEFIKKHNEPIHKLSKNCWAWCPTLFALRNTYHFYLNWQVS